jgi:hypothetical protein
MNTVLPNPTFEDFSKDYMATVATMATTGNFLIFIDRIHQQKNELPFLPWPE